MQKVIAFGEALIDMLSSNVGNTPGTGTTETTGQETFTKFPGGAPANVAAAVGKLGGRSYFAGKVGADMFGDFLKASLEDNGVNTDYLLQTREAKTALAFVSLDAHGERSFEFYRNPSADTLFRSEDFQDEWFQEPGIFHFCSNTLTEPGIRETTLAGLEKARSAGFVISFDLNLRENLWPENSDPFGAVWSCIKRAHVVKLSAEELAFLCGDQDEDLVLRRLQNAGVALIVITDGGAPMRYYTGSHKGLIQPVEVTMVDSTAAGDAFVGGLLYRLAETEVSPARLTALGEHPEALKEMLQFASACGAHAVTRAGAFTSLPSQSDLESLLRISRHRTQPTVPGS
ncbi:carbohydrate kinase family protein [Marinobacter sp. Arc7-DN-1]|uniref:carbohydrate kinase family protein n=1 Tax=Marinobacter sp. Arc7-DN-1 TaxID=2304594 RepID=UPI000E43CCFA|nr:carbohydrate kinase [Marinobacter sp. Arc7-DN-1]AXS82803.1 carbohydrate kinase [Marinobacter sp. Arc7-DN-1]